MPLGEGLSGERDQIVTALTRTIELIETAASSAKTCVVIVRMDISLFLLCWPGAD